MEPDIPPITDPEFATDFTENKPDVKQWPSRVIYRLTALFSAARTQRLREGGQVEEEVLGLDEMRRLTVDLTSGIEDTQDAKLSGYR
jgi:hypothetical protein